MKFRGESVPQFGDSLQKETDDAQGHVVNGINEASETRETTEENTSVVEETPILNDPEGASDGALFGIDSNGETIHSDEDEPILFQNGKRIETLETKQTIKKRNKTKEKDSPNGKAVTPQFPSISSDIEHEEKTVAENIIPEREIVFAKPLSDTEFEKKKEVGDLITEITDFVDKAEFIPAHLYEKAQVLNDQFLNEFILSLPDDTVVFLDKDGNNTKTLFQIREHMAALNEQRNISETKFEKQKESHPSKLENLFNIAQTKDDLIAIIARSTDLNSGLQGTHQVYSKDDLIALIEATWIGDVGIDHLPRTAGFREAVDRVREHERELGKYVEERVTAEQIEPIMSAGIQNGEALGVPENSRIYDHDKENNSFVYNYTNYPRTEENRKKNTGIFGRLWKRIRG